MRDAPEQVLAGGRESLERRGLVPLLSTLYEQLIAALRRAAELLGLNRTTLVEKLRRRRIAPSA